MPFTHASSRLTVIFITIMLMVCATTSLAQNEGPSTTSLNLTEAEKEWIAAHPVIKSPTTIDTDLPPIYSHDEMGVYTGIGVDIAEYVASQLGITIEWVPYNNHMTAIDALINRDVDFVSFMGENMPGEGTRYTLSNFFRLFPSTLIVPKSTVGEVTLDSLHGKRLACVNHWPEKEYLAQHYPDIELVGVNSALEALQKVAFGEVDACVLIIPVAAYEIQAGGITTLRIGGTMKKVFRQGFGVRSDWPIFVDLVNKCLAAMPQKDKTDLYNKWVPVVVSEDADYARLIRWIILIGGVLFVVFSVVVYWNRKLARANLAERKARLKARQKAEEALSAKQKMEKAIEEEQELRKKQVRFVDMISHEYRTPVAVLQTNLDIMQMKNDGSTSLMDNNYANMQLAITRLTELLNSGLDRGQLTSEIKASFHVFDLSECVQATADHVSSLWPDRSLNLSLPPYTPANFRGDQQLIKTALLNVMENALKYSPVESSIDVTMSTTPSSSIITITDRGIGIPTADQDRVFEKYFRADHGASVSGTGVGLFLVKKAVELHDGVVDLTSARNDGTTITLTLPLVGKSN